MDHVGVPGLEVARVFETNKSFYNLDDFCFNKTNGICPMQLGQMQLGLENLEHSCIGGQMKGNYTLIMVIQNIRSCSTTRPLHIIS